MTDLILAAILLIIVGVAVAYIVKAKKRGVKCIGCPASQTCKECSSKCNCCEKSDDSVNG